MSKAKPKDEIRDEYRREDLGPGVRGKYLAKVDPRTSLINPEEKVTGTRLTSRVGGRTKGRH
jgi:hypothetical protein